MKIVQVLIEKIRLETMIPALLNLLFCIIVVLFMLGIMELLSEKYREKKIKGELKQGKAISKLRNFYFLKKFAVNLEVALKERDKEGIYNFVFYSIITFSVLSMLGLILVKQILLAILMPVIVLWVSNEICIRLSTDVIESIEEQLPNTIDNIVRISSKYSDIKSIIYEASTNCEQPIKGILENMSREMLSAPADEVLMDYAEKFDNVWFYSVVFTLISYLEDSSKDETIKNLKHLRDILEKENAVKKASVTDKKYSVMVNLVIALSGVGGFILNLLVTPNAKEFFFSTFAGLTCFVLGFTFVIMTIFINIKMSKTQKK